MSGSAFPDILADIERNTSATGGNVYKGNPSFLYKAPDEFYRDKEKWLQDLEKNPTASNSGKNNAIPKHSHGIGDSMMADAMKRQLEAEELKKNAPPRARPGSKGSRKSHGQKKSAADTEPMDTLDLMLSGASISASAPASNKGSSNPTSRASSRPGSGTEPAAAVGGSRLDSRTASRELFTGTVSGWNAGGGDMESEVPAQYGPAYSKPLVMNESEVDPRELQRYLHPLETHSFPAVPPAPILRAKPSKIRM